MLTKKQHELLVFIDERLSATNVSPSFEEMKQALGLKSKSGIHRLITALEERGFIRKLPHRARALEVLRRPGDAGRGGDFEDRGRTAPSPDRKDTASRPEIVRGKFGVSVRERDNGTVTLNLVGKIAAGIAYQPFEQSGEPFEVPGSLVGPGKHFAIQVDGDSMVDAGILDGDIAIIRQQRTAENGRIVVALVEGRETTLKRLRRRDRSIALEPANPNYEPQIFGPEHVEIQGELVGLVRRY